VWQLKWWECSWAPHLSLYLVILNAIMSERAMPRREMCVLEGFLWGEVGVVSMGEGCEV
jgi:hypothetical protein